MGVTIAVGILFLPRSTSAHAAQSNAQNSAFQYRAMPSITSLNRLSETRARPVFSPTREPGGASIESDLAEASVGIEADELKLIGTRARSSQFEALVAASDIETGIWLQVGETIEGWELTDIQTSRIEVANQSEQVIIALEGRGEIEEGDDNE